MTMIVNGTTGLEFPDGSDQTTAFTGNASTITSGTLATARLGSGTANSSTYLRGDQTWASIPATTPGGSNTQVQFNNSGAFGGSANLTFNGTTLVAADITDSSLTPGRVVFPTTGGNLTGSANLFWDNTNNRLGIGTSSPAQVLDVTSNDSRFNLTSTGSGQTVGISIRGGAGGGDSFNFIESLNSGGTQAWYIGGSGTANALAFRTNGNNERMRLTANGGVAFGGASNFGSSGQLLQSNGDAAPTWVTASNPVKAWVNFNGNGGASIRASFNVSSVSYNSTGRYTVNFTSALADANYCVHTTTTGQTTTDLTRHALINGSASGGAASMSTTAVQLATGLSNNGSAQDMGLVCASMYR